MYLSRFSGIFGGFFAAAVLLAAQTRPMPGTPPNPTSNFPGNPGGMNGRMGRETAPEDMRHPILLNGKVTLDDGSVPSEPVRIERVCSGGRPHAEGFTDIKGRFSVTLGQEMDAMPDASEAPDRSQLPGATPMGGMRDSQIQNCELRAVLAGFRSDTISLAAHRYLDNPDVGTIVLHRMANVQGLTISATSALAPKDARKAYEKALEAEKKNKPDEAQKELEKAVALYPKYAAAWFELGRLYESRDHFDQARDAYNHSISADANYINPYERVFELDARDGKWQDAAAVSEKVLRLNPYDFPRAYYLNAFANFQLHNLDAAEKSAREAVRLDTSHQNPRALYLLGIILADKQDFTGAAENLRAYLQQAPDAQDAPKVKEQLAQVEKAGGAKQQ